MITPKQFNDLQKRNSKLRIDAALIQINDQLKLGNLTGIKLDINFKEIEKVNERLRLETSDGKNYFKLHKNTGDWMYSIIVMVIEK